MGAVAASFCASSPRAASAELHHSPFKLAAEVESLAGPAKSLWRAFSWLACLGLDFDAPPAARHRSLGRLRSKPTRRWHHGYRRLSAATESTEAGECRDARLAIAAAGARLWANPL